MSIKQTLMAAGIFGAFVGSQSVYGLLQTNVTITGTAKDCIMTEAFGVSGVNVSAYKLSAARAIAAQLDTMSNFRGFSTGDTLAVPKMNAMEAKLQSLIVNTIPLSRKISGPGGAFVFSIAPVDSLLVVGFADHEDDPYYYGSKLLSGLASTSVLLDMSGGQCGF